MGYLLFSAYSVPSPAPVSLPSLSLCNAFSLFFFFFLPDELLIILPGPDSLL